MPIIIDDEPLARMMVKNTCRLIRGITVAVECNDGFARHEFTATLSPI
jgi:hypothetical protein